MIYRSLRECANDLERNKQLIRIKTELDPDLEIAIFRHRIFVLPEKLILSSSKKSGIGSRQRISWLVTRVMSSSTFDNWIAHKPLFAPTSRIRSFVPSQFWKKFWKSKNSSPSYVPVGLADLLTNLVPSKNLAILISRKNFNSKSRIPAILAAAKSCFQIMPNPSDWNGKRNTLF